MSLANRQGDTVQKKSKLIFKKPIEFTGKLQERFEQLKKRNRKVPTELKSHQNLDAERIRLTRPRISSVPVFCRAFTKNREIWQS